MPRRDLDDGFNFNPSQKIVVISTNHPKYG